MDNVVVHDFGVFCSPLERVNLASNSRWGTARSLSDLPRKGLAPGSRNANQPSEPNLTRPSPRPRQRALSKSAITLEAALSATRHPLFITHSPSGRNQTPLSTARHPTPGLRPWPRGLGHWKLPAQDPARAPPPGSRAAQPCLLCSPDPGHLCLVQILGQPPGGPQAPLAAGSPTASSVFPHPSIILHSPYRQWNDIQC